MPDKPFDLSAFLDENAEEPQGRGLVCQMEVEGGFMFYPSPRGVSPDERFFSAVEFGEEAKEMAQASAPSDIGVRAGVQITLYADSVKGEDSPRTWKNGRRTFQWQPWHSAYADAFRPTFEEAAKGGMEAGKKEWVHVTFVPDPYKAEKDPDADPEWIPTIHEYLVTESAAEEYAEQHLGDTDSGFEVPTEPTEWAEVAQSSVGSWKKFARAMGESFIDNPKQAVEDQIWAAAGVTKDVVTDIRDAALTDTDDKDVPF